MLKDFGFFQRIFLMIIFLHGEIYSSFHNSFICLEILFNVSGKAML
jgi:hypothetical protein